MSFLGQYFHPIGCRFSSSASSPSSSSESIDKSGWDAPAPTRNKRNELVFEGHDAFRPNRTPKEVLQVGERSKTIL